MAAQSQLDLTWGFTDDTKRKMTIAPFAEMETTDIAAVKAAIINFNKNDASTVAPLLISDTGASSTGIVAAVITTDTKTEINLNDGE